MPFVLARPDMDLAARRAMERFRQDCREMSLKVTRHGQLQAVAYISLRKRIGRSMISNWLAERPSERGCKNHLELSDSLAVDRAEYRAKESEPSAHAAFPSPR